MVPLPLIETKPLVTVVPTDATVSVSPLGAVALESDLNQLPGIVTVGLFARRAADRIVFDDAALRERAPPGGERRAVFGDDGGVKGLGRRRRGQRHGQDADG